MLDHNKNLMYFNTFLNLSRAIYMSLEKNWDKVAQVCGLSSAQQHCLWIVFLKDEISLSKLAQITLWNKSTTSALVTRLEKRGLLEKSREKDSHEIFIRLTKQGKDLILKSVFTNECEDFISIFEELKEEEIISLLKVFQEAYNIVVDQTNVEFEKFIKDYSENVIDKF
ncbi:MarR family winged helix-turn-helix transcriptional regulator [Floccifex sp.]|uniref:MarR family winged helix-turn-helix transcriptional regulator n=1 Tax=Floccifex sp. TaxID=2815810 RepID=UPI003F05FCF7